MFLANLPRRGKSETSCILCAMSISIRLHFDATLRTRSFSPDFLLLIYSKSFARLLNISECICTISLTVFGPHFIRTPFVFHLANYVSISMTPLISSFPLRRQFFVCFVLSILFLEIIHVEITRKRDNYHVHLLTHKQSTERTICFNSVLTLFFSDYLNEMPVGWNASWMKSEK